MADLRAHLATRERKRVSIYEKVELSALSGSTLGDGVNTHDDMQEDLDSHCAVPPRQVVGFHRFDLSVGYRGGQAIKNGAVPQQSARTARSAGS